MRRSFAAVLVAYAVFVDIVAYSIAVPVLPDLSHRLGASPTLIGLLFASFGVTVLGVSVPMGAMSDRTGRKLPLVAGLVALAASTMLFAFSDRLSWLFAARLAQGAADAVTWVVGFALLADLYGPTERGRVMGFVMAASSFGFMVGPTLGGWLYQLGGIRLPFLALAAAAAAAAFGFAWLDVASVPAGPFIPGRNPGDSRKILSVLRTPAVASCAAAVVVGGGTIAMLEPVLSMFLSSQIHLGPARIGLVFGASAVAAALLHPLFGRLADKWGGRRLTLVGLVAIAVVLPLISRAWSFESAVALNVIQAATFAVVITPSLTYMGEAVSSTGHESFGVAYGVYNVAWALGILIGPAIGGFLFEHVGFTRLTLAWAVFMIGSAGALTSAARGQTASRSVSTRHRTPA